MNVCLENSVNRTVLVSRAFFYFCFPPNDWQGTKIGQEGNWDKRPWEYGRKVDMPHGTVQVPQKHTFIYLNNK